MAQRNKIIWLHRIGYLTTAIVVAELVGVGLIGIHHWNRERARVAYVIDKTRTHEGPLLAHTWRSRPDELDMLATLPPLQRNGLRFAAMPFFTDNWIAVSISTSSNGNARGHLKVFAYPDGQQANLSVQKELDFTISNSEAMDLLSDISTMTQDWGGADSCIDGAPVAFELSLDRKVTSGRGNSECSYHYGAVSLRLQKSINRFIPPEARPANAAWRQL